MKIITRLAALALSLFATVSHATTYEFTGSLNVNTQTFRYSGSFDLNEQAAGDTIYYPGETAPVQQGFSTVYFNAITNLRATVGNSTLTVLGGLPLLVENITQAEAGTQFPKGLSAYFRTPTFTGGVMNGFSAYFSFLAVPALSQPIQWSALDTLLGGNAEQMLQSGTVIDPTVDPTLTGTQIPTDLAATFHQGVLLGVSQPGLTQVSYLDTLTQTAPVPEPHTYLMMLAGLLGVGVKARRKALL